MADWNTPRGWMRVHVAGVNVWRRTTTREGWMNVTSEIMQSPKNGQFYSKTQRTATVEGGELVLKGGLDDRLEGPFESTDLAAEAADARLEKDFDWLEQHRPKISPFLRDRVQGLVDSILRPGRESEH